LNLSIRSKLLIAISFAVVLSVVLTASFSRYIQKKFIIERAKKIASDEVTYLSEEIKDIFKWALSDLMILRSMPELQNFINSNSHNALSKKNLEKVFYNFALYHKIFYQLRLLDSSGKEIVRINFENKPFIVPDKKLQVKYHRYYFQKMLQLAKGDIYISPFDLNIEHHMIEFPYKPVIRIGLPVYDKNGNSSFYLILNLDGNLILNLFKKRENKKLGQFLLIDSIGNFLYHPEKEKRFCFMLGKGYNIYKCIPELKKILQYNNERVDYISRGIKHFSIIAFKKFKPVNQKNAPQFTVLYSINDPELLVGFAKYLKYFVILTFMVMLICLCLATFIALTISKPILALANITQKIQRGDLSARVNVNSKDEIGLLGNNFNQMAYKLEKTISSLKYSEQKYKNLFENSQDTVFLIDFTGKIIELNEAGYELFEIKKDRDIINIFDFTDNFMRELLETGVINDKEIIVANGKFCSLKVKVTGDNIAQGILRDVTEIKKRHEERIKAKKLMEEQIIVAEEKERRAIGQLIHEQLAQDIVFLHLKAQEIYTTLQTDSVKQILKTTETMLQQIRGTIFDLCPVILDEHGLIDAIRCFGENFQEKTGINISFYTNLNEEKIKLKQAEKFYFFRIFKELLHNILKHADAKETVISLHLVEKKLRLIVDDDGKGFNVEQFFIEKNFKQSIGLFTIKKWIENINGTFFIESEIGKGTRVVVEVTINND